MNLDIFRDVLFMIDLLWMQLVVNLERERDDIEDPITSFADYNLHLIIKTTS